MPYSRRYSRKTTYRRRRYYRRKMAKRRYGYRPTVASRNKVVHYFMSKTLGQLNFTTTTSIPANSQGTVVMFLGVDFALNDLNNVAEYTTLFDLYRINGVQVKFLNGFNTGERDSSAIVEYGVPPPRS